jgi:retron-type reverse transcriptase
MGTEETKEPNGQGKQVSYGKDVKGREMRTAETILNIIQDRGMIGQSLGNKETREPCAVKMARTVRRGTGGNGRNGPRPQSTLHMYLRSYAKLYPNDGAMTPGMTEETVDGWSREKVAAIIVAIRDERWQWTPVKRVLLDKPKGGKRPLGLPVWSDKVVQDIRRSILEAS